MPFWNKIFMLILDLMEAAALPLHQQIKKTPAEISAGVLLDTLWERNGEKMEAPSRIELLHKGFADLSLTTWARRHHTRSKLRTKQIMSKTNEKKWSGRRDSNSRQLAWEASALPLNYSRTSIIL
jgi:hypothetical protein